MRSERGSEGVIASEIEREIEMGRWGERERERRERKERRLCKGETKSRLEPLRLNPIKGLSK